MKDLLKKIDYALRKDSLSDAERIASARQLVSQGLSDPAPQTRDDGARQALENVRIAILEADPQVLCCTLWMPDKLSKNETVVDYIDAALSVAPPAHSAASTVEPVAVRLLDWQETFVARGDGEHDHKGWEAENGMGGWYVIETYFASDSLGWNIRFDYQGLGDFDCPDKAKAAAQEHFSNCILAALAAPTTSPEPDTVREALEAARKELTKHDAEYQHVTNQLVFDKIDAALSRPAHGGWESTLKALLDHVDKETCSHEETKRGGSIWTICVDCGQKWADDEGGFKPRCDVPAVANARALLARNDRGSPEDRARAAGWVSEQEHNGEHDGVRHPETGNWAENWVGACAQMEGKS